MHVYVGYCIQEKYFLCPFAHVYVRVCACITVCSLLMRDSLRDCLVVLWQDVRRQIHAPDDRRAGGEELSLSFGRGWAEIVCIQI